MGALDASFQLIALGAVRLLMILTQPREPHADRCDFVTTVGSAEMCAWLPLQYAGYCLFGLFSMVLGIVYYSDIGSEFVAVRNRPHFFRRFGGGSFRNRPHS
eukprot:COSAG02_NODE_15067_length_1208_cov_1.114518_2_plen_102_part_00